jgi:lipoyl-dependent peroxiredoxin
MRDSKGTAEWIGGLKDGNGTLSTGSGAVTESPYSFGTRFGQDLGTNPEELIAAAHAACFAMAFSGQLGERGLTPESIKTTATVSMEKTDAGVGVTRSHLEMVARVPGATQEQFRDAADAAKTGCPISRLLNAKITLDARLEA